MLGILHRLIEGKPGPYVSVDEVAETLPQGGPPPPEADMQGDEESHRQTLAAHPELGGEE